MRLMMRLPLRQAEQARLRVARLRPRRDGADLEEAEAQRGQRVDVLAVLVEAGGQADGVGEVEPHHAHRLAGGHGAGDGQVQRQRRAHAGEGQVVGGFGVEREEDGAGEAVEQHGGMSTARQESARLVVEFAPDAAGAPFDGAEVGLVGHLAAVARSSSRDRGRAGRSVAALLDLPEDVQVPKLAPGRSGSKKV